MAAGTATRPPRIAPTIWVVALTVAFAVDGPVACALAPYASTFKRLAVAEEIKEGGHLVFAILIAVLLGVLHRDRWRAATLFLVSVIIAGVVRVGLAFAIGRVRPIVDINPLLFRPFNLASENVLHAKNLSFPSGHAAVAFASAVALSYLVPRGRRLFWIAAALVAAERVGESAHYVSDVVASALLAVVTFRLVLRSWPDDLHLGIVKTDTHGSDLDPRTEAV